MEHTELLFVIERNVHRLTWLMPHLGALPAPTRMARGEFVDTDGDEARPDAIVLCGEPAQLCLLFEIQRNRDKRKPDAWLRYQQQAMQRYQCAVKLIVLSPTASVTHWASSAYLAQVLRFSSPDFWGPEEVFDEALVLDGPDDVDRMLFQAAFAKSTTRGQRRLTQAWHEIRQMMKNPKLEASATGRYLVFMKAIAPTTWWRAVVEADMQYVSFTEKLLKEGEDRGIRRGREEGREEWRREILDMAAQFAAPILPELQALEDPKEISRQFTAYMKKAQR